MNDLVRFQKVLEDIGRHKYFQFSLMRSIYEIGIPTDYEKIPIASKRSDIVLDIGTNILDYSHNKLTFIPKNYQNLEKAFIRFKKAGVGGTELDLSYLQDKNDKLVFVANVFYRTKKNQKMKITNYINENISNKFRIIN